MSYQEVQKHRKAGNLLQAYTLAKQDLEKYPDDIWAVRAFAWTIYDYAKANSSSAKRDNFLRCLAQLKSVNIPAEETIFWKSVTWLIRSAIASNARVKTNDFSFYSSLFEFMKQFPIPRPDDSFSALLQTMLRVKNEWHQFADFCEWWDFQNLQDADFHPQKSADKKKILSMAERAFMAYSKVLLIKNDKSKIVVWIDKLQSLIEKHPEYIYLPFYNAKLLIKIENNEQAVKSLIPFLLKKRNEFWVWELFGDAVNDSELRFALYCKAMLCKTKDEMKISLREKMFIELKSRNYYNEARTEWQNIIDVRMRNKWSVSPELLRYENEEWFINAENNPKIDKFYRNFAGKSDEIVEQYMLKIKVTVTALGKNNFINFITEDNQKGFFKAKGNLNVQKGDKLEIICQSIGKNKPTEVVRVVSGGEKN